jgi:hypothetical protein
MALAGLSLTLAAGLHAAHLPAAVLIGCMAAGIMLAVRGQVLRVSPRAFALAQAVLGCLMARSLKPSTLHALAVDWSLLLGVSLLLMAASGGLGWILMRRQVFPGSTAVWGLAPGAASAMVLMADAYGADARLVAFMQYARVVVVTSVASFVAWLWQPLGAVAATAPTLFAQPRWPQLAVTLGLVLGGALVGRGLRIPAGPMLMPLLGGSTLQYVGWIDFELPDVLLAVAYAVIGWTIGLRFTPALLRHALRALPQVLGAIAVLIAVGASIAVALNLGWGVEPLTAYLASSPGGADSVAIIAASSAVDAGFVMAMQVSRFLMVLAFGPGLTRWIAGRGQVRV